MGFLNIPAGLGPLFQKNFPGFWEWLTTTLEPLIATRLATQGDVRLLTAGKGIYLISPNGTKYYVTVSNAGALVVTPE
jgi:hypothetical protein